MSQHGEEPGPDSGTWVSPGGQPASPPPAMPAPGPGQGPPPAPYGAPPAPGTPGTAPGTPGSVPGMLPGTPPGPSVGPPTAAGYPGPGAVPPAPAMASGPGAYGEFMFPEVVSPGVEPLAVASVATFPIGPLGLGLGIAALRRVRRNHKRSPALAGTGIVLGLLSTAAAVLTIVTLVLTGTWDRMTERPVAGDVSAPRVVASANVAPGNCLRTLPVGDSVGEVTQVPCATEHEAQAIAVVELPEGADGSAAGLLAAAATVCADHLTAVAGTGGAGGTASTEPWYFVPSEQGWREGARRAVCLLRSTGGSLTTDYFT